MSILPDQEIQENLSYSLLRVVAENEGYIVTPPSKDKGTDLGVQGVTCRNEPGQAVNRYYADGTQLDFQVKSTKENQITVKDSYVIYDLEVKNYNDLISRRNGYAIPLLLVLVIFPNDRGKWLEIEEDVLILRKNAYWFITDPNEDLSENSATVRIKIPVSQRLQPNCITKLFDNLLMSNQ